MAEVVSCGFIIYRDSSDSDRSPMFLLMRHVDRWDLPKGHVDPGESEMECALRELEEETGIKEHDITIDESFRYVLSYPVFKKKLNREVDKDLIIFLARLDHDVEIVPTEHEGFEWFAWEPPHEIQTKTIDGALAHLAHHWDV
ncbi:MAG: NUDIX domain-containing protein [Planctomycetota bacterium]